MFIKTLRHKSNSIKSLITYIHAGIADPDTEWVLAHNLPSTNHKAIVHAFHQNDQYRSNYAKTRWYHEVLSFSPLDRAHLTSETLWQIAQQYIQLRNPNALVYAAPHTSEAHTHIHFAFSGTEYKSPETLRLSDQAFKQLQENLERFQLEQFPELQHSIVYLRTDRTRNPAQQRDANRRKENHYQMQQRAPETRSERDRVTAIVQACYDQARTQTEFYESLKEAGLELYTYRNKVAGIRGKRKYRFSRLGITKDQLRALRQLEQRWQDLEDLQTTRTPKDRSRD